MTIVPKWNVSIVKAQMALDHKMLKDPSPLQTAAKIVYTMIFGNYTMLDAKWHMLALWPITTMLATCTLGTDKDILFA